MNYKLKVGNNINHYRKMAGLTLKQVADRVGITEATMQKYEKGLIKRVDIEMLDKIATAINTSVDRLTGWLTDEEKQKELKERQGDKWNSVYDSLSDENKVLVNSFMTYLHKNDKKFPIIVDLASKSTEAEKDMILRMLGYAEKINGDKL